MSITLPDHSTLEVSEQEMDQAGLSISDSESAGSSFDDEKYVFSGDTETQVGARPGNLDTPESEGLQSRQLTGDNDASPKTHRICRRKRLILGIAVALTLMASIILGTLLGLRNKANSARQRGNSPSINSDHSNSTIQVPLNSTVEALPPRKIAALSFASQKNTSDGVKWINQTRIYYQDNTGELIEGANTSINSTWETRRLGVFPLSGSAIAAAVTRPSNKRVSNGRSSASSKRLTDC
jgi:hypothetical protein